METSLPLLDAMNRAARFFDADFAGYEDDLPILEAYAQRTGGPILELGCGTGRALIQLARAGYTVTGVDLSPAMLALARAKAEQAGVAERMTWVQGDYGDAPLAGPYRLAFTVMNTFLHLSTQAEQVRALKHWCESLAPGGLLLIDILHPDAGQLAGLDGRLEWWKTWVDPQTGNTVSKFVIRTVDLAAQTMHNMFLYDEVGADGLVRRTPVPFDLRYVGRYEMALLLDRAGFAIEALYGDWDLGPFESESSRMIWVARRRA